MFSLSPCSTSDICRVVFAKRVSKSGGKRVVRGVGFEPSLTWRYVSSAQRLPHIPFFSFFQHGGISCAKLVVSDNWPEGPKPFRLSFKEATMNFVCSNGLRFACLGRPQQRTIAEIRIGRAIFLRFPLAHRIGPTQDAATRC
jgi:hypothetical protein